MIPWTPIPWSANHATVVFMPLNEEMALLVTKHSDLLIETHIPQCLLDLSAHVHGYRGVIAAWGKGDYSGHMSLVSFPGFDLYEYARSSYERLKTDQARFLGH